MKDINEVFKEIESEKIISEEYDFFAKKFTLAESIGFGFSWFKGMMEKYLKYDLDEDDMVFEYESFAYHIKKEDTLNEFEIWAEEHFGERWNHKKYYKDNVKPPRE